MYTVAVRRDFIAHHFLVGGDWGAENTKHSHHYEVEAEFEGATLDEHNYLVDIVDVESSLEALVARYRDNTLNELEEFQGLNPSIEHLARVFCQALCDHIQKRNLRAVTVRVWESRIAWASYRHEF